MQPAKLGILWYSSFTAEEWVASTKSNIFPDYCAIHVWKNRDKTKKKSCRRQECGCMVTARATIFTDRLEGNALALVLQVTMATGKYKSVSWLSSHFDWLLVWYTWCYTLCVLGSAQNSPHTTGFLVANIKHVDYLQSLLLGGSDWTESLLTHPTKWENQTWCTLQKSDNRAFDGKGEIGTKICLIIL